MEKVDAYKIVLKPVLTEKGTWETENRGLYRFEVAPGANKIEIAKAVESLFGVKVGKVNTLVRLGKERRRGAATSMTPPRKIALVTVAEGKIELL
jgi:large subunit ribosomal protein L23